MWMEEGEGWIKEEGGMAKIKRASLMRDAQALGVFNGEL